jgi:uncharacterized alpha-E superfamily protein
MDEWAAQPSEFFAEVKEGAHLFSGVTLDTFPHGEQFLFIRVGKNLERAGSMLLLLKAHAESLATPDEGEGPTAGKLSGMGGPVAVVFVLRGVLPRIYGGLACPSYRRVFAVR